MKIKHVYWFAYFNVDEPSVRYRATYPLSMLKEKYGIGHSIVYPGYDLHSVVRFLLVYFGLLLWRKDDSVIVFQKIYTKGFYTSALKLLLFLRPAHTLYDIDDAEYTRYPDQVMNYFMKRCSACSVGSISLRDHVSSMNENVILLTSPVMEHGVRKEVPEDALTVGWIGYYSAHRQSLMQLLFPALREVDFPVKLKLLGVRTEAEEMDIKGYFSGNSNISVEAPRHIDWHDELSVYERIRTFDVGVAPLIDTEFNRAKSAFKLKQCLSCGVPVLASYVGENTRFIVDGVNGRFCDSPDEYYRQLLWVKNASMSEYMRLSANAAATLQQFSMDHYCDTLLNYFSAAR